jgi:sugar phosphate isomerase/epimerase
MFRHATKLAPRSTEAFTIAQEAGYDSVEFWLCPKLIDQWQDVLEIAKSFPFEYQLHFPNRAELSNRQLENLVRLYHELTCSVVVIHQPMHDEYAQVLTAIDGSLRAAVENHFLDSSRKLCKWAESFDYLTLDVEHLWLFTLKDSSVKALFATVESLLQDYGDKIIHVHLPGYLPGCKEHRPQYCSRDMVMKVFSLLADYDYNGFVVSETANRFQNREELTMDRLLFQRWVNKRLVKKKSKLLADAT